jgi:Ca2+/Na+ antiporter
MIKISKLEFKKYLSILKLTKNVNKNGLFRCIIIIILLIFIFSLFKNDFSILDFIINLLVGAFFLCLALYFDQSTEEKIEKIKSLTEKSERALTRREQELDLERKRQRFINFMESENYHNIRIPELKTTNQQIGLEYTIVPVRDPNTQKPIKYENEMESMYIVKVNEPACWDVIKETSDIRREYDESVIKIDAYYYCKLYNYNWHLSIDNIKYFEFYLSSKVGTCYTVISANTYMEQFDNQMKDKSKISCFYLDKNGDELDHNSLNKYQIYVDNNNKNIYLRIHDSRLKLIYLTNSEDNYDNWFMKIGNIQGYAHGDKLRKLETKISSEIEQHNLIIPKIPWHHFSS